MRLESGRVETLQGIVDRGFNFVFDRLVGLGGSALEVANEPPAFGLGKLGLADEVFGGFFDRVLGEAGEPQPGKDCLAYKIAH